MAKFVKEFSSFARFLDHAENVPPVWANCTSKEEDRPDWFGTSSFGEAVSVGRHGWPEGRKFLSNIQDDQAFKTKVMETRVETFDVAGGYTDIGRAIAGDPEHMINVEMFPAPSPILKIGIPGFIMARVPTKIIMVYGGAIASYVDALETAGWRCEITQSCDIKASEGGKKASIRVILKQAEEPLDTDRLLFAIAHPSMFRRLMFRAMETFPELEPRFSDFYGYRSNIPPTDFDIYIPPIGENFDNFNPIEVIGGIVANSLATLTKGVN